ncbi:sulfatase-like hydrolase/transferase [Psychroflexus tropicus]|uniref:sulfatase-like hydrolase/transferase n=1 Tax=Psychroflexus tropicus TaxID=197345 RepID=UPI0003762C0A|nr:sulfatase-like hydrolase/transferase [Psychroflexus tropicus]
MKSDLKVLLIWFFPVITCFVFELSFAEFRGYSVKNLIENSFIIGVVILSLSFIRNEDIRRLLLKLFYLVLVISFCIESIYFYVFDTYFSTSAIFIFLETNLDEVMEFSQNYFDFNIALLLLINFIFGIWFLFRKPSSLNLNYLKYSRYLKLIAILTFSATLYGTGYYFSNFQYQFIKGVIEYRSEIDKYESSGITNPEGDFEDVKFKGDETPHTFILVIGESTTRHHMGIYDFHRSTTPKLSNLKSDLLIYQDVISPHSHTIESLQEALTLNNFKSQTESTIIQLFNQAGFKTYWFSNQNPIGIYDTLLSKIAKASDEVQFTNMANYGSTTPFDEVLLPLLDDAIADQEQNTLVVLHLLATHGRYQLRYPEQFEVFTGTTQSPFRSESNDVHINTYHNSIVYVDHILKQVISKVEAKKNKSYVLYFSDHGEEVFLDKDFFGHNDLEQPTRSMFDIPFILWRSDHFKNQYALDYEPNRPYSIQDLIHSVSDLSQIKFKRQDLSKSIFSDQFKPFKRIISGEKNYDTYFKK